MRSCQQSCRDGQALQESTLLGDAGQSHHGEKDCQDEELRKREAKAASVPQAGEGKRTAVSKELYLQTGEEGSKHEEQSTPAKGFAALLLSTNQSGPLLYLDQEMKLHLGLPHLWFLLGSPRADPLGLLPLLKVLWHLKNNAAFT